YFAVALADVNTWSGVVSIPNDANFSTTISSVAEELFVTNTYGICRSCNVLIKALAPSIGAVPRHIVPTKSDKNTLYIKTPTHLKYIKKKRRAIYDYASSFSSGCEIYQQQYLSPLVMQASATT